MNTKARWVVTISSLGLAIVSSANAALPEMGKVELLEAIKFADSIQVNVDSKYVVNELFNQSIHGGRMPEKRRLEIEWRREGIRDYYDVTVHDGKLIKGNPFRIVTAYNGEHRKQWMPNENKGDTFKEPHRSAWPVPIDFGLTLGKYDKTLGESLEECEIDTIRRTDWQGNECYYIEAIQPNGSKAEVWIDPAIGWRARNVKLYRADGLIRYEATADFNDLGNSIYFPFEGTAKMYGKDPNTGERVVSCTRKLKLKEVKVNKELTQEDFDIKFPSGTEVFDHIHGIGYIAGVSSLQGVEDAALNEIAEIAESNNILLENAENLEGGVAKEDGKETTKANGEPSNDDTNRPAESEFLIGETGTRSWWPIALLSAGVLCAAYIIVRRKAA
ncbi:MAG: LolA-like protein [Planctomycetota bacterium]|jgi:hypothetical protein